MFEYILALIQSFIVLQTTVHGTILTLFVMILYSLSDLLLDSPDSTLIIPIIAFIYAGAIIVLFIFCLTLLSPSINPTDEYKNTSIWYGFFSSFVLIIVFGIQYNIQHSTGYTEMFITVMNSMSYNEFIWSFFAFDLTLILATTTLILLIVFTPIALFPKNNNLVQLQQKDALKKPRKTWY